MNRPTIFDQAVPPLSRLLALCVEGEREAARAPLRRYGAANPADPMPDLLLRFLAAAAADERAVLQATEREPGEEDLDADYFARLGARLGQHPALSEAGAVALEIAGVLRGADPDLLLADRLRRAEKMLAEKDRQMALMSEQHRLRLEEEARASAACEAELAALAAKREQQAALLDKLAYINEELENQIRELLGSRWRRLGRRLGLAKPTSFER